MSKYQKNILLILISYIVFYISYYSLQSIGLDSLLVKNISLILFLLPSIIYVFILKPAMTKISILENIIYMSKAKKFLIFLLIWMFNYQVISILNYILKLNNEFTNDLNIIAFILPIIIYIFIIKNIFNYYKKLILISTKAIKIKELNNKYQFNNKTNTITVKEQVSSKRKFNNITKEEVIRYYIENDINCLRKSIENTILDLQNLKNYKEELNKILLNNSDFVSKKNRFLYQRLEKRIISSLIYQKENLLLNVKITITYHAYNGAVWYKNIGIITWKQILNIYNEWLNDKKYCETTKRERNKVTSTLRYEVLKRDHFTCKMCGATVKDGIKLQVDNIIPVSKGGKTTMSNLQTLCQRCNQGKSNKI